MPVHSKEHNGADAGEPVAESPFPLRIVAAKPEPRKSGIKVSSPESAVVNELVEFEVQARDAFGNRCSCYSLDSKRFASD